jgi:hypothetical protein
MTARVRAGIIMVTAAILIASGFVASAKENGLPPDIGTHHLGVLWPGSDMDFSGGWVRPHPGPFIWGWIERTPGVYDWTEPDLTVEKLQGRRVAILATVWSFAPWDQARCHAGQPQARGVFKEFGNLLYSPCDLDAYLAWLTATVERYDGDGVDDMPGLRYPIRHWEVLNEPEMQGPELCFFQEDPDVYAELLRHSHGAIKSADPPAVVFPAGQSGMHSEATDYWNSILSDANIQFDVANIHSIRCSDMQLDAAFWAPEYTTFLARCGREAMPYWITEAQVGSPRHKDAPNDDKDARDLFIGTVIALSEGADVILHVLANDPNNGKGQLAVGAFNLLGRTIGRFTAVERIKPCVVRFELPDDRTVYALWDGARVPAEVDEPVTVITYLEEIHVIEASEVVALVPSLIEVPPRE